MSAELATLRLPAAHPPPLPALQELAALIGRHMPADGSYLTPIPGLTFHRASAPAEKTHSVARPALGVLAQGAKRVELGDEVHEYTTERYLLTSVDLPVASRVTLASSGTPYLSMTLDLDTQRIADLMTQLGAPTRAEGGQAPRGMATAPVEQGLITTLLRLVSLLDTPDDIPILAPLIEREIHYRLLKGELGQRLCHIVLNHGAMSQISRAIDWLKRNYCEPLRIEDLAQRVNMSASSLHHHFKSLTAMSPLQYQKQLRLHEARRLMLAEMLDAGTAAHRVGYESASQFSREYSRLYGAPPLRDVGRLRRAV
ncbi:araC family transcriptional regulator [Bordetella ansorpii]|uniref:AraC family transcriptional regulator n=1 Tax=Bordetella ansorpii TaxID=288768 RepID=A0A157SM78_9BORD|nr:AraC family transcriptional regulator [Bordetella ansorpii]SAI71547.1 araC family transcriptional regulator [Bordetella ansorpii]